MIGIWWSRIRDVVPQLNPAGLFTPLRWTMNSIFPLLKSLSNSMYAHFKPRFGSLGRRSHAGKQGRSVYAGPGGVAQGLGTDLCWQPSAPLSVSSISTISCLLPCWSFGRLNTHTHTHTLIFSSQCHLSLNLFYYRCLPSFILFSALRSKCLIIWTLSLIWRWTSSVSNI